ncbi:N-acetylmuramoyl-L-alanine amidase [Altererythrobacter sp. SALINAS58]|uniref:N-acetylmuramoyl-L-alanine amidase family protein n=1 Tax=Alteripontixanthobacter muriae TaxID=2705546 RepID=UPI0015758E2E|nr:N-acetylmuramoyl-L-alanine amidase [Alteripontixanthobacter muriae]NTZ41911.1 N-acetylmuramoyl-L-alanine amidase [Alteripontixanthobacter muriae]
MTLRYQLWLLFLAPVLLLAMLYALGRTIDVPLLGRDYVLRLALPAAGDPVNLPKIYGPQDRSRPLVVIDAGHGGKDPGAVGADLREKDIVLQLATTLKDQLVRDGGIRVAMTREDDRLLALGERSEIARRLNADLFISVHADSAGEQDGVSGASVYTLSNEASSRAAALFAERENEADVVNGIRLSGRSDEVNAILVELSQRRMQSDSAQFAGLVLREGEGTLQFHPQARRSASLAVLRAPDVPSVLYEAGFITNPEDAARLASDEGQARFADAMSRAVRVYFARKSGN